MQYGIKQYIFVIRELTAREIKRKYSRSVLGILWSVLQPLLFMAIMSMVFSGFSLNSVEYPVYFITGYLLWSMFYTGTSTAMTAFEDNKNLLQRTKLPRVIFVLSRNYTAVVNMGFTAVAVLIVYLVFKVKISWLFLIIIVDAFFEILFTIGVSFILATAFVFIKDLKYIWQNFIVLLVHVVALYVPIERYPKEVRSITQSIPIFIYENVARRCVLEESVNGKELLAMALWGVGSFLFGWFVFKINEGRVIRKL